MLRAPQTAHSSFPAARLQLAARGASGSFARFVKIGLLQLGRVDHVVLGGALIGERFDLVFDLLARRHRDQRIGAGKIDDFRIDRADFKLAIGRAFEADRRRIGLARDLDQHLVLAAIELGLYGPGDLGPVRETPSPRRSWRWRSRRRRAPNTC